MYNEVSEEPLLRIVIRQLIRSVFATYNNKAAVTRRIFLGLQYFVLFQDIDVEFE